MSNEEENALLDSKITTVLSNFDFKINSLGYLYLFECIKCSIEHPMLLQNFDKKLYPCVSKIHSISNPLKIKWNVEKSINSMFRYTNNDILYNFFKNQKPSPVIFIKKIITIVNKL